MTERSGEKAEWKRTRRKRRGGNGRCKGKSSCFQKSEVETERVENRADALNAGTGPLWRIRNGELRRSGAQNGLMLPCTDESEVKRRGHETERRREPPARGHLSRLLKSLFVCLSLCVTSIFDWLRENEPVVN